ncbi:MAG: hypothetical protein ACFB10_25700 [Salibacteraceae bacterium]
MDAVFPLSNGSKWNDNELRYTLRSLHQNFTPLNKIWIVGGHLPAWIKNARHLPFADPYRSSKDANLITAIIIACLEPDLSDDFLFMSDDQMLLRPLNPSDFRPYWVEDMQQIRNWGKSKWQMSLRSTYDHLSVEKLPTYNYEGHVPYIFNKHRFPRLMLNHDFGYGYGYTINTLYHNQFVDPETYPDFKHLKVHNFRAGFFGNKAKHRIEDLETKYFLAFDDAGLTPALKVKIQEKFPSPSPFE